MCNNIYMKINLKTISLIVLLGTLFYFWSNKTKNNKQEQQIAPIVQQEQKSIDKNSPELPSPKVYIYGPAQNGLMIGNNWKSR